MEKEELIPYIPGEEEELRAKTLFANEYAYIVAELTQRCEAAGIVCEKYLDPEGDEHFSILFQSGREKRSISFEPLHEVADLLAIPFEKYVFLAGYRAICSYQDGVIEAAIRGAGTTLYPTRYTLDRIKSLSTQNDSGSENNDTGLNISNEDRGIFINIGPRSAAFSALSGDRSTNSLTMKITGLKISQHDRALDFLVRFSNAVFFEIDLSLNLPLVLTRYRSFPTRKTSSVRQRKPNELQFPRSGYDEAPMSLYWYARSASGMPLLQFLAYYQVVEFYFPAYSETEAQRRVQNILKNPTFSPYNPTDISNLLAVIKSGTSRGYGNELTQLSATVRECLDPQALWTFLNEDDNRKEALSKGKLLPRNNLPLANKYADVRELVGSRIYEIRCKVVHTKNDNGDTEVDLLLPFSKEAESLDHDIELIRYVAQQVLIVSSSPFKI